MIQFTDLGETNGGMEFGNAEVVADEWMQVGAPVYAFMIMAMVGEAVQFCIKILTIGDDGSAFGAGDDLDKVE